MRSALLILLCFLGITAIAQNGTSSHAVGLTINTHTLRAADAAYERSMVMEDEDASDALARKALDKYRIALRQPGNPALLQAQAATRVGELAQYFRLEEEALRWYRSVIDLPGIADSLRFRPLIFCGIISYGRSRLDSADYYFEAAERIQSRYPSPLSEAQRLYNNRGALFFAAGNYRQARNYFERALELLPRTSPSYRDLYVNYESNLAAIQVRLDEYDDALARYRRLLPYGLQLTEIRNNIGIIHLRQGRAAEALRWLEPLRYDDARMTGLWNDRAEAWLAAGNRDQANACLRSALAEAERRHGTAAHAERGRSLRLRGDLKRSQGDPRSALNDYQAALHQFDPAFVYRRNTDNPQHFAGLFAYLPFYETLLVKAGTMAGLGTSEGADAALDTYTAAFRLADYVSRTYDNDEARLLLQKAKYGAHGASIDLAFARYRQTGGRRYLEQAFSFDQQNKASLQVLYEQEARGGSGADSLWRQVRLLRAEIGRLSLRARSADPVQQAALRSEGRRQEIGLERLLRRLHERHPGGADSLPSVAALQALLPRHTALLSYHFSGRRLTVFLLSGNRFEGRQTELYPGFEADLRAWQAALRSGGSLPPGAGQRLYGLLLAPYRQSEKRLLLIPDDELLYLPFESLPTEKGYLAEQCVLQYAATTALLRRGGPVGAGPVLAFAPFSAAGFTGGPISFSRLPASASEAASMKGATLTGAGASKERFRALAGRYPVLHLATHAVANDSLPGLSYVAFAPGELPPDSFLLYASEIYDLSLPQNRLLVLSACETGTGALVRGEGLFSLGRAFAYAGCANRITTLWKADDVSTADILRRMYRYLEEGKDPGAALQLAKAAYLADPQVHPRRKAPAYWAHLVYTGELPDERPSHWLWWVLADLLLVGLSVGLLRRRRKRITARAGGQNG
ncbi:MAG: CHAT domain-containing protein [Chitinophagaceae bacterium]|nr:MAG: CHAT domain-containing protein [Chitinophagaceae bacterium]